jgi:hypothetical protein
MLDFLFFISFVNLTINNSIVLIPTGNVYNVNFNISLPPRTELQEVTYFQNYSYFGDNYFTHFFLSNLDTKRQFSASANVIRKFKEVKNLNFSKINDFLSPTEGIESNNPYIIELARRITNNSADDFEKVARIALFVYKNISYDLSTVGLDQSALSTLLRKSGVCEGKARLFVALARAAGIPSRLVTGLSVQDATLGLHAWAEVYLGKWIEVDPTWFEIITVDAGHIITEREGLNRNIYYETYGASLTSESLPLNLTSKVNKILTSELNFNLTYSSLSIPGNGKAIIVVSVDPFYGSDVFRIPPCLGIIKTSESYSFFEPNRRNAIIEINATNQQGFWVCGTSIDSKFFKQQSLKIEVGEPKTIEKFYAKLAYESLLPWQKQTIYITPTASDLFTIASPCFLKQQKLLQGITYSFSFPACANFVYVANSQTFSKLTFSFQKPIFQVSEKLPKSLIEGNNFTIFVNIKTNASKYQLVIEYANDTNTFDLSGNRNVSLSLLAKSNILNLSIVYDNEIVITKVLQLNLSKPSFELQTKLPKIIILDKNFTLNLNVSTNFEGPYTILLSYGNQTRIKNATGNSSFIFDLKAINQSIVLSIFYLGYNITKTIQPNYVEQPQIVVRVISKGNQTTLTFDFKNYAKNITIKIGELTWFFNSENNSKEEIKIFGYGNFICNITFYDLAGNLYNASFPFSNIKPKSENTLLTVFVLLIVAIIIFVFLHKLMHR